MYIITVLVAAAAACQAMSVPSPKLSTRRLFLAGAAAVPIAAHGPPASALGSAADKKRTGLSPTDIAAVVTSDVEERKFMVTADFDRTVYSEKCTFTDETNSFEINKFVSGTEKLFVGSASSLRLTSPVVATADAIDFTFAEELVFNIPLKPIVSLTGRMHMTRDSDGLIDSYREYWDGGVSGVLKTARPSGV